ncbi:MAG TPA: NeuD/PglB/VioB family sugar acetyltransferase [Phycisphaerales bacterium]|nr:NeuD/PglB/VioB family sugar acetyltransferase [Phycisphaerales bacterium]
MKTRTQSEQPSAPSHGSAGRVYSGAGLDLAMVGGGGHALVVSDAATAGGWAIDGVYDDDAHAPTASIAVRLGPIAAACSGEDPDSRRYILAMGHLGLRERLITTLHGPWGTVVHPRAWVSPIAVVREGVFVGAMAVVQGRATVGRHAIVNTGAIVEHDCVVADNVHIAPGAVLGGAVMVGSHTLVGLGSRVLPGVRIGSRCVVGTGAAVIRDVPDGATVVGVPARVMR